jgi:hypothetical protein
MRRIVLAAAIVTLAGCGYVGDPLAPALNIPEAVKDLKVIQRGDKLVLDFTAPALTTEALGITSFASAEAQIGDKAFVVSPPKPGATAQVELPAGEFVGQEVGIRVALSGPKRRKSAASNLVTLRVIEPLLPPDAVKAEAHPEGVLVTWKPRDNRSVNYRIVRIPDAVDTTSKPEYLDRAVELGKEYKYSVVALAENAESLPSASDTVIPGDIFAPAVPVKLTAIAGVGSIELAWDRGMEPDLKNYRVYRNDMPVGDVETPSFSDRQLTSGATYRYAVSAIDQTGNESGRSATVEVTAP